MKLKIEDNTNNNLSVELYLLIETSNCKLYTHFNQITDTNLELSSDGVLIHVNIVLVDGSHDELVALRLHPRRHEGSQVQPGVPVQHQLIVYDLIRCVLRYRMLRHLEPEHTQ